MVKKMKKILKVQNIIILFLIICSYVYITFFGIIEKSDEIWNFQNIIKMCNGYVIYKDSNVIITPMFFYIGNIICRICNNNIIGFRIYNIIICTGLCLIIYKIFKDLKVSNKFIKLFITLILEFLILVIIGNGANYNILAVIMVLYGMDLYISQKSNNILQGGIICLVFLTKQNIGIYYAIAILIYELYQSKLNISYIKMQLKKFLFFCILMIIFIIPMVVQNNLYSCISYVFGGILDFGEKNFSFTAGINYYFIFLIIIVLYIFICIQKTKILKNVISSEIFDNITLLFVFSMVMTLIVFPIVNSAHFSILMVFYLIFIFYYFDVLIIEEIFNEDRYTVGINYFTIIILSFVAIRIWFSFFYNYFNNTIKYVNDKNSHFYGFWRENTDSIENIKNYIIEKNSEGIDVIVCSYEAAMVMIDLNQSHGAYDLPFNGNFGYDGVNRMKQDILAKKNTEFLIFTDEEDMFWQESKEIRDCIINNLNYVGDIENYSIYSTEEQ